MGNALTTVFLIFNFCKQPYPNRIKKCPAISPLQENIEQTVPFTENKEPKMSILFLNLFLWRLRKTIKLHLNNNNQNIYSIFQAPSKTISAVCIKLCFSLPCTASKPKTTPHGFYCSLLPRALPTNILTLPQFERKKKKKKDVLLWKEFSPGSIFGDFRTM